MKNLIITMIAIMSVNVFASTNCEVVFDQPHDRAMSATYVSKRAYKKLVKILEKKGYSVSTRDNAVNPNYKLSVNADYGYGCGTGLTFFDYFKVPAYNSVVFEGLDLEKIKIVKSFLLPVGVLIPAKRHLIKTIKSLPTCELGE